MSTNGISQFPADSTHLSHSQPERYLVLVATTTREKVDQYRAIARAKGLPVEFRPLTDVEKYFHVAAERSGNRRENAKEKLGEIEWNIAECRKPDSPSRLALERKCVEWGIKFNPRNVYFATDDSTFTVASDIWRHFKKKLEPYVEEDLLKSKHPQKAHKKKKDGEIVEEGPGAEFGPIASAVGITRFFNLFREAAQDAQYSNRPVGVTQHVTMLLHCLEGDRSAPPIMLEAERHVFLHTPKGLTEPFAQPADAVAKTEHFLRANGKNVPLVNDWTRYVTGEHERSQIVDDLAKNILKYKNGRIEPARALPMKHDFVIGAPTLRHFNQFVQSLTGPGVKLAIPDDAYLGDAVREAPKKPYDALSQESMISKSDALLFTPFEPSDGLETRTANYLALFSAKVAKLLIARDAGKPIVIMNHKGCWQGAIDTSLDLVDKGMFKDHLRGDYDEHAVPPTRGVEHLATRYFDVVSGDDLAQLRKAAIKVLEHRRKEYIPFDDATALVKDNFVSGGPSPLPPDDMFKVAVFVSAQSDNKRLLTDMRWLGHELADKEFGLIWGGGDRHGMGAVYDGYRLVKEKNEAEKNNKKTWMAAFSTVPILRSETEHGAMPEGVDYWEQNIDIYQRMAHMIHRKPHEGDSIDFHANAIVVAPGGDGTFQEWLATLQLKHQFPEMMQGKSLILYTPDLYSGNDQGKSEKPFWEKGIKAVMGENFYKNITENHKAYGKTEGIYLATNKAELMRLLEGLSKKEKATYADRLAQEQGSRGSQHPQH